MFFNTFLCLIIYFTSQTVARDVRTPPCTAWKTNGTVIIGSESGENGSNATFLSQPTAVAVDENNTLYVVDSGNNRLMKYQDGSSIGIEVNISGAILDKPQDIAIDQLGAMYISEAGGDRVVKWTVEPPNTRVLMSIRSPSGIYLDEATSELYVVGLHDDGYPIVMRYNLIYSKTEIVIGKNPSATAPPYELSSLYSPVGIHVDRWQQIYVVESDSHRITRWRANESLAVIFAGTENCSDASSNLCNPTSFILDDKGTAYIADTSNNRILHWNATVKGRQCFLGCPYQIGNETIFPLTQPYDITFDNNFNILVVEKDMNRIKRFDQYDVASCLTSNCRAPTFYVDIRPYPSNHIRSRPLTVYFDITLNCYTWITTSMTCSVIPCYSGDRSCNQTSTLSSLARSFLKKRNAKLYIMKIPPFALSVGTYKFSCRIAMPSEINVSRSIEFTIKMIRSPINITLLPLGKSKITLGYQQEYTLSPKVSLIDTDPQSILFVYYCRKYPYFGYTTVNGVRLNIDLDGPQPRNSSCFNLQALPGSFHYENTTNQSLLTIMSQSLKVNQIYEFYVELYDGEGLVDRSDVILIEIQSQDSPFIEISPILNTLILDTDYQLLNPSTQLLLESSFIDAASIQWKSYTGIMGSDSIIVWKEYNYTTINGKQLFYGLNSSFLTVTKNVFSLNAAINYWQFVATYTTKDGSGSASVQLKTNHPPVQQYCAINPFQGYTNQSFTVTCANWTDVDGIKDYSLHVISSRSDILMSIAYSKEPIFSVYLPSGDPKLNYTLNLIVHVRDNLGAWTESTIIRIIVKPDGNILSKILNFTEDIVFDTNNDQLINSYAVLLNQMALEDQTALMNKRQVQISDLIISTFETIRAEASLGNLTNASIAFIRSLNRRAIVREYFLNFVGNSSIFIPTTIEEIIIQSSIINQLAGTTSEWTQASLDTASKICNQFSRVLYYLSRTMTIEDVLLVVNSVTQCTSNAFTGVNGPLQRRGFIFDHDLNKDFFASKDIEYDYTQYNDYEWLDPEIPQCSENEIKSNRMCREDIIDEENSNQSIYHTNSQFYKQKLLARKLGFEIRETMSFLAKAIRRHLNMFQDLSILAPACRIFVEQIYQTDIENKSIDLQTRNASIYLPSNLTFFESYLLGVQATLLPLAPEGGPVDVKFSTVLTLSILDDEDHELEINATDDSPIEMFIPRDVNVPIPSFVEESMTQVIPPESGTSRYNRQFFIYYVNITQINPNLTVSIHFELKPVSRNISYFMIYKLDEIPAYNSTDKLFDGSAMLCGETLDNETDYYTFYIDNLKTAGHKSLFLGIRESEENDNCSIDELSSITDEPYGFLDNYFIRIYSSGCYYLNQLGFWKSDGMKVGPKTNFKYTHCYSNHT